MFRTAKFLMAVDCVTPGYAPFQGFDITTNFHEYLKMSDQLLAYDFNTFVGGHLTAIGNKTRRSDDKGIHYGRVQHGETYS